MIVIEQLDHLVLTVASIERTAQFYARALGMRVERFGAGRTALHFGTQKINLHEVGRELEPKAARPTAGSGDLCFIVRTPLDDVLEHLRANGVGIEDGPVERTGATGRIRSLYLRDPDGNLLEVSNRLTDGAPTSLGGS